MNPRHLFAIGLLAGCLVSWGSSRLLEDSTPPAPEPTPSGFSLRGKFISPSAASDAAMLASLCNELADCIERDGSQPSPRLRTAVAFDDLRVAAREARMDGESIGDRQPHVKDAIQKFLESAVGTGGGPVTTEGREAWVGAFREIGRACADAQK